MGNVAKYILYTLTGGAIAYITYWMIRDCFREPDYTVTRRMIEEAEQKAIFGDDWEYDWDDDDEE